MPNSQIAEALEELGDLYELDGAVVHRVLAYRNAAKTIRDASTSVAQMARDGRATELTGVGATLAQKILDLIETGTIPAADKLRARFPAGLLQITGLPGLGPKRARRLFDELGIDSPAKLQEAAAAGQLRELKGFGEKFETSVLAALASGAAERKAPRTRLDVALELGELLIAQLQAIDPQARIELAGSARRRADSVKDLDIVVATEEPTRVLDAVAELELIESGGRTGESAARARAHSGIVVEVRAVAPGQFGNLLQHLTGSGRHNAALRERAVRAGLHLSEYGIASEQSGETTICASEEAVYGAVGLPYIEPELRECRGELEGDLPTLIELGDIRGDLHCHTIASDGQATILEMGRAAIERGYEYLAITDHSATHGFGNHVTAEQLRRQIELVREADTKLDGIRLLAGTEVNILPDGSPDYDDELLGELDWVIASVHTGFAAGADAMTERMVKAIEHPLVDAIGHPTGRLIERREPYAVDIDALIAAAAKSGTLLEINANPARRDLSEVHARSAAAAGAQLVINSDAHKPERFSVMQYGIWTARRAWLGPSNVANTLPWEQLRATLKRSRVGG